MLWPNHKCKNHNLCKVSACCFSPKPTPQHRMVLAKSCSRNWRLQTNFVVGKAIDCHSKHVANWNQRKAPKEGSKSFIALRYQSSLSNFLQNQQWDMFDLSILPIVYLSSIHHQLHHSSAGYHWIPPAAWYVALMEYRRPAKHQGSTQWIARPLTKHWNFMIRCWRLKLTKNQVYLLHLLYILESLQVLSNMLCGSACDCKDFSQFALICRPGQRKKVLCDLGTTMSAPLYSASNKSDNKKFMSKCWGKNPQKMDLWKAMKHSCPRTPRPISCGDVAYHPLHAKFQNHLGNFAWQNLDRHENITKTQ